jgi:hypothetical protein
MPIHSAASRKPTLISITAGGGRADTQCLVNVRPSPTVASLIVGAPVSALAPAPLAKVTLRGQEHDTILPDVSILLDSGADVTLIPQDAVHVLGGVLAQMKATS